MLTGPANGARRTACSKTTRWSPGHGTATVKIRAGRLVLFANYTQTAVLFSLSGTDHIFSLCDLRKTFRRPACPVSLLPVQKVNSGKVDWGEGRGRGLLRADHLPPPSLSRKGASPPFANLLQGVFTCFLPRTLFRFGS